MIFTSLISNDRTELLWKAPRAVTLMGFLFSHEVLVVGAWHGLAGAQRELLLSRLEPHGEAFIAHASVPLDIAPGECAAVRVESQSFVEFFMWDAVVRARRPSGAFRL